MSVIPLAAGVDYTDLHFVGHPGIIATVLLHGVEGVAIVDPGPSTSLPVLEAALRTRGFAWADVQAILLTHIHLDHAGATGSILALAPHATVYVHERGSGPPDRSVKTAGECRPPVSGRHGPPVG
jgi:glyoxylase-like metal-dependent hydrolase (beta-lactamase superfamily II)